MARKSRKKPVNIVRGIFVFIIASLLSLFAISGLIELLEQNEIIIPPMFKVIIGVVGLALVTWLGWRK